MLKDTNQQSNSGYKTDCRNNVHTTCKQKMVDKNLLSSHDATTSAHRPTLCRVFALRDIAGNQRPSTHPTLRRKMCAQGVQNTSLRTKKQDRHSILKVSTMFRKALPLSVVDLEVTGETGTRHAYQAHDELTDRQEMVTPESIR